MSSIRIIHHHEDNILRIGHTTRELTICTILIYIALGLYDLLLNRRQKSLYYLHFDATGAARGCAEEEEESRRFTGRLFSRARSPV